MASVVLKQVKKVYDPDVVAVHPLDLEIKDKEFMVLVGPSGCGKSTTLRMIAGLEDISDGELFIDDKLVNDIHPKDRDIAMVFQNYALYPHMSVYDNMAFGLKLRKVDKAIIDKRVQEAAEILGITEYLDRKPKALSGGQRQRVAVGRAIVRNPKVFLFDEPLSNLDAKLRVQMRTEISRLHSRLQATMIYVTHDQVEAMTMGDRILVIKDGFKQQVDTPMNLYHHPANKFVAGFIGSPPMNFIEASLTYENDKISLSAEGFNTVLNDRIQIEKLKEYNGKKVIFGIRPEDLSIDTGSEAALSAEVDVVEPLGSELYVYAKIVNTPLTIRMEPDVKVRIHDVIKLKYNKDKMHIFDIDTEKAII